MDQSTIIVSEKFYKELLEENASMRERILQLEGVLKRCMFHSKAGGHLFELIDTLKAAKKLFTDGEV